jgi:hypothetical protein
VEHTSGGRSVAIFPELICADQPILDIRELSHEPHVGVTVKVRMEGDAFEMEDHRNWTDASFKTYARPLARGYPYAISAGEQVEQSVSVIIAGAAPSAKPNRDIVTVTVGKPKGSVPRLGLYVEAGDFAAAVEIAPRLATLKPSYLIGRVDCREGDAVAELDRLVKLGGVVGCPLALQAVIHGVAPESELGPLAAAAEHLAVLDSILIVPARDLKSRPANSMPAGEADAAAILAVARKYFPGRRIGGGMPVPFAELNRNRPPPGIDFLTHATQGTVHASDDISVMETLTAIPDVIRSARSFAGDIPYRLGPSTIGVPPFTAPSGIAANPKRGRVTMAADDPRQQALFGAAFSLGLAAIAAREGLEGLTFAAVAGLAGLFRPNGMPSPSAAIFGELASLAGAAWIDTIVEGAGKVAALAAEGPDGPRLLVANCSGRQTAVRVTGHGFRSVRIIDAEALDPTGYVSNASDLLDLSGYAIAILR